MNRGEQHSSHEMKKPDKHHDHHAMMLADFKKVVLGIIYYYHPYTLTLQICQYLYIEIIKFYHILVYIKCKHKYFMVHFEFYPNST